MLNHAGCEFVLAKKNFAGLFLFQEHGLLFAVRAHHGFDARVDGAGDLDHFANVEGIGSGDHQDRCAVNMGLKEHRGFGGIAGYRRYAALAQALDDFAILLGDDNRYAMRGQRLADAPANAAVADDDNMSGQAL